MEETKNKMQTEKTAGTEIQDLDSLNRFVLTRFLDEEELAKQGYFIEDLTAEEVQQIVYELVGNHDHQDDEKQKAKTIFDILDRHRRTDAASESEQTKPIVYKDMATFAKSNPFVNEMSLIKDDEPEQKIGIELKEETITEGDKKLQQLTVIDNLVLNTIVLDFYYKQEKTTFTDKEVATWINQENAKTTVPKVTREQVNESILKLQNIRVDLKYRSLQEINNEALNLKIGNPLLWIRERLEVEGSNGIKKYEIITEPFYFTYLKVTNTTLIEFKRELLTNNYKGVDKSLDNQAVRYYLIKRLEPKNRLNSDEIFININDIYEIQGATPANYTTAAKLRKAKERARKRAETILNEFKKEYKFTYYADDEKVIRAKDEDGKTTKKVIKGRNFTGYNVLFKKI